ncbi:S8 family serine peptidase [Actinoplanes teichomyceticus]|uniref:Subtilase family protein n=1 Tax=Actinoplanes teichomyceticus TaxID=1867 RepID=A0A561VML6_ACTTI|nr:S8 family serine peptidase [Actinoplanes teichomyceticus]TWG12840.1 subtilase family protein [Actinoplanes teichomyceticus]GIF13587.1 hypothetical protein Ate01nite_36190 [Actinoplanes teichomyceticus]
MVGPWWAVVLLAVPGCPAPAVTGGYRADQLAPLASGASVRVAVVDSGVDAAHPLLAGRVGAGRDLLGGRERCAGHGTAVAVAVVSVAPGATIVAVRVADGDPGDAAGVARVAEGIRWAAGPGRAQVINVSLVVGVDDARVRAAVAQAVRRGVVVVAAAGNDPARSRVFPAAYPGVIGVGAVLSSGEVAPFSPVGPQVDVVAAGDGGTSVAAGFVSGTAALLRQRFPGLSPGELARRLVATSDRSGRVNPYRALTQADLPPAVAASTRVAVEAGPGAAAGAGARGRALRFAGVVVGVVVVGAVLAVVFSRGRRRGWRAATDV